MEDLMNRINDEIQNQCKEKTEKLIIDDLFDIYKGKYKNYVSYKKSIELFNATVYEENQKLYNKLILDGSMVYQMYLDKMVVSKSTFDYILTKRLDTLMVRCKIERCIELLSVDGINSKEVVKTKLKEILEVL